jgi:hypothetical protein
MYSIIPLAGPDFYSDAYGIKPLVDIDGQPLLSRVLESRPWWSGQSDSLIFVLRQNRGVREVSDFIAHRYPNAQQVILSSLTNGALFSALAGLPFASNPKLSLCIDLVDIVFSSAELSGERIQEGFVASQEMAGIVPYFCSSESCYSYVSLDRDGWVLEAAEKRVISRCATAGAYIFRDIPTFLACVGHHFSHEPERFAVHGKHFVCPVYNSLISGGGKVRGLEVNGVLSLSKDFHPVSGGQADRIARE